MPEQERPPQDADRDHVLAPGFILGDDYKIVRLAGRGGAGKVYEARQISLKNMRVAVKVLHRDINEKDDWIGLLKKEVIISRELTHENIIKVYSLEKTQDQYFIVMEYVPGKSLQRMMNQSGELSAADLAPILFQVCDALQYAHNRGVVHLDIKPGNIMVSESGHVKLCDFGIARAALGQTTTATSRLVIGSVGFMAPEQYSGRWAVSPKSDIYALAATVYYVLTGEVPSGVASSERVPPCTFRAMERDPANRFESVEQFWHAFALETGCGPAHLSVRASMVTGPVREGSGGPARGMPDNKGASKADPIEIHGAHTVDLGTTVTAGSLPEPAVRAEPSSVPLREPSLESEHHAKPEATSRKILVPVLVASLLAAALVAVVLVVHSRRYSPEADGKYKVETFRDDWFDTQRRRQVPVKIYYPKDAKGRFPAIVFSHDLGGSRDAGEYVGQYWAGHGYVSVHVTHKGTDAEVRKTAVLPLKGLRRALLDKNNLADRQQDVSFAVDQIEAMSRGPQAPGALMDPERIGMAGHSLGALTALVAAGQLVAGDQGQETHFAEPRIKAAVLLNPPVSDRLKARADVAFSHIAIPCLHITGGADMGPLGESFAENRRIPFDRINGADQYLITFPQADHGVFAGKRSLGRSKDKDPEFQRLIAAGTTAFFDAYLKADRKAKAWLTGGKLESALAGSGSIEAKIVSPVRDAPK